MFAPHDQNLGGVSVLLLLLGVMLVVVVVVLIVLMLLMVVVAMMLFRLGCGGRGRNRSAEVEIKIIWKLTKRDAENGQCGDHEEGFHFGLGLGCFLVCLSHFEVGG